MSTVLRLEEFESVVDAANGVSEPQSCLICRGRISPWLQLPGDWRRPGTQVGYEVGWCTRCKLGRLQNFLTAQEIEDAYRVPYIPHAPTGSFGSGPAASTPFAARLMDRLVAWRPGTPDIDASWVRREFGDRTLRVCELGCGSGRLLEAFRSAGHRVVGVEPDAGARQIAQGNGLQVYEGTAESLPESIVGQRFDVVLMHHVLEHCVDPRLALERAWSLLEPDGTLVLETPNNEAIGLRWAGVAWPWLDIPRHLHFFTAASLRQLCEESGFEVSSVGFRGFARQFQSEWIESEKQIARFFKQRQRRVSRWAGSWGGRWLLLAWTLLAPSKRRFDSVRVVARRPKELGGRRSVSAALRSETSWINKRIKG